MAKPSIVLVTSLVARGSVGGRAGLAALERLGFPVVLVPTVTLPWHPGHGPATRMVPATAVFARFVDDLAGAGWLGEVGAVLTGYLGAVEQVAPVARLVTAIKTASPAAVYLCDPVIGDGGGLFQPESLAVALRDTLLPLADIATPNRFELGWLTGADGPGDVHTTARRLGPSEVVVTSASIDDSARMIDTVVVTPSAAGLATHRLLPGAPHGTGDLFAALYLGHRLDGAEPEHAMERAAATVLALVAEATARGLDELPLTALPDAIAATPGSVAVRRLGLPAQADGGRNTPKRKPA